MIKFGKIQITNFASIKQLDFDFDTPGVVHVVRGKTGSGKTSLFSALYYVTYGEPLKKKSGIEPWKHIRDKDSYMGTKVEMTYYKNQDTLKVIRCKNYKGDINGIKGGDNLFIFMNGKEETDFKNKAAQQKYIEDFLGISTNLFKHGIVFGQKMNRFIEETGPKQKEIFDEFCSTTFINLIREDAKEDLNQVSSNLGLLELTITNLEKTRQENWDIYETLKRSEENFEKNQKEKLAKLKAEIKSLKKEDKVLKIENKKKISKLKATLKSLNSDHDPQLETNLNTYTEKLHNINRDLMENIFTVNELKTEINKLKSQIKTSILGKCAYCHSITNKATQAKQLKEFKGDLKSKENQLKVFNLTYEKKEKSKNLITESLKGLRQKVEEQRESVTRVREIKDKIKYLKKTRDNSAMIERLKKDIYNIEHHETQEINSPKYYENYKQTKRKLKELKVQRKGLVKNNDLLNWLIKDPLSNNGLKAFIFKDLISEVNLRLANYSSILGLRVKFGIKDSKRKDFFISIIKNGNTVPYEDLSGGQQQLITVSIVFAMHDIVTKNLKCNLLIMDEIFEHLDSENVEKVAELIQKKIKPYTSLFLITHLSEYTPNNSHTINVSLVNDFSKYKL